MAFSKYHEEKDLLNNNYQLQKDFNKAKLQIIKRKC